MRFLENKIAIVTGASRGIGKAIAQVFSNQGAMVIGTATSQTGVDNIRNILGQHGHGEVLNVADQHSIDVFWAKIQNLPAPTILINNAGITKDNIALRMKASEWHEVINTNLNSIYYLTQKLLKGMLKARWGRIINISSMVASSGNPGQSNYAAAKAGMQGYSRSLAHELGSRGITVNCIAPGFFHTDMTDELSEKQTDRLLAKVPIGRFGEADEIAALAAFLASDSAGYITGETIHINGGMYMT